MNEESLNDKIVALEKKIHIMNRYAGGIALILVKRGVILEKI